MMKLRRVLAGRRRSSWAMARTPPLRAMIIGLSAPGSKSVADWRALPAHGLGRSDAFGERRNLGSPDRA